MKIFRIRRKYKHRFDRSKNKYQMQRNGLWQIMSEPTNFDRPSSGVGLAASRRLDNEQNEIRLIPCADGGTSLDDWAEGGALFENATNKACSANKRDQRDLMASRRKRLLS